MSRFSAAPGRLGVLACLGAAVALGCDDPSAPGPDEAGAFASEPVLSTGSTHGAALRASPAVYVSMPPGTVPEGSEIEIRHLVSDFTHRVQLVDGGFDPVPIPAGIGDQLRLTVLAGGAVLSVRDETVRARRPPTVVRISPPRGKRDIPLNASIVIVFSEPVNPATATGSTIRLLLDGTAVAGTVLLSADGVYADFVPAEPLAPTTTYVLTMGTGIRDLAGDPLVAEVASEFTTSAGSFVELHMVSGDGQAGPTLQELPQQIAVQVLAAGIPSRSAAVHWTVTSGDGLLTYLEARTDTGGIARASWTLGSVIGTQTAQAAAPGAIGSPVTFTAHASEPPLPAAPSPAEFAFVSAGARDASPSWTIWEGHTCGLTEAGAAFCWGGGDYGQLGSDAGWYGSRHPKAVSGDQTFSSISAGAWDSCALTAAGSAYCWGSSWDSIPAPAFDGVRFLSLQVASAIVCGIMDTGAAYCPYFPSGWAAPIDSVISPPEGSRFVSVSVGSWHVCALEDLGKAYCWGGNFDGRLGDGSTTNQAEPVAVTGGHSFVALTAGESHSCGLAADGAAYCWGAGGALGDGSTAGSASPVAVSGGLRFSALASGGHTCGLTTGGRAYCWGANESGQLGDGSTIDRLVPTAVLGGLTFASISVGGGHTCAATAERLVYCWGWNHSGALGNGTDEASSIPVQVLLEPRP